MLKVGLVLEIDVVAIPVNIKLYYFNKYTQDLIEAVLRLAFCACMSALAGARVWYALLAMELQEHFGRL